ncbi:hypothetical protein AUL54_06540 [Bacillus sp. SDLI1]|uniref:Uncharacterized protein n=1 Tax=Bacillus siamensis TaxID=659243 RepID=A0AAI8HQU5_9BACI|nr:hypothetical protein AUL54_06540 [Bacillus sp. SDLI1]AUJ78513.1 hypothetical protein CWD84_17725 [Bacillus siamensis]EYB35512.1 hypothetical protein AW26_0115040 [Bacillus amyloliquefaciens EBL11]
MGEGFKISELNPLFLRDFHLLLHSIVIKKKRKHMRTADKRHDWANRKWGISYNAKYAGD